ncbi:MAG: VTC domain-containing protein, partial [Deltaproteobacteria bacterium]|nr:VTC domain-containing protein [Deltaproteobacteria bacterium]
MTKIQLPKGLISGFLNWKESHVHSNLELRFETKFVTEAENLDSITRWIRGHGAGFRKLHPPRKVHNIYFDTFDLRSYGDNLAGISRRIKSRLRWYGSPELLLESAALEFKNRSNKMGWKTTYPLENIDLSASWKKIRRTILGQIPDEGKLVFESFPVATIINQYYREYYQSSGGDLRVTVDRSIKVFDQRNTASPRFRPKINLPEYAIVEFKFMHDNFTAVGEIIRDFPLRPS